MSLFALSEYFQRTLSLSFHRKHNQDYKAKRLNLQAFLAIPRSVFRDETILYQEYLPHQIPHREPQLKKLELFFQSVVQSASKASQTVMITGPVGSGKTLIAKKLLFEFLPK